MFVKSGQSVQLLPNLVSYVVNFFAPEEGTEKRKYWAFGYNERKQYYQNHPIFPNVDYEVNEWFQHYHKQSLDDFVKPHVILPTNDITEKQLNVFEAMLMEDPQKLFYRMSKKDIEKIRPEILALFFISIDEKRIREWLKPYINY